MTTVAESGITTTATPTLNVWRDIINRPVDVRLAVLSSTAMVGSLWLRWARVGVGDVDVTLGRDLISACVILPLLALVATGAAFAARFSGAARRREAARLVVGTAGFVVMVVGGLAIFTAETIAALPSYVLDVLPTVLDHLDVEARGERGLWLVAASGTGLVVAATGFTSDVGLIGEGGKLLRQRLWARKASIATLGVFAVVAWARYEPWVTARTDVAVAASNAVDGAAMPWLGPMVFSSLVGLGLSALWGLLRPGVASSLLGVWSAWSASFIASFVVVSTRWLGNVRLSAVSQARHLPEQVVQADPRVTAASAPTITVAASFIGVAVGLASLRRAPRHHIERVTARSRLAWANDTSPEGWPNDR